MKKIRIFRLDEWHPGARSIQDSINYFIETGLDLRISQSDLKRAIELLINKYNNPNSRTIVTKEEYAAIQHMNTAIDTMLDDGWPEDWIYQELEEKIRATN